MNAVTQVENQLGLSLKDYDVDQAMWSALTSSIFPGAKPESIVMAVEYCKARNLDIMKKPCHIVPMSVKDAKTGNSDWRDVIMPSIAEHRITASRSHSYAGIDAPVFGPMVNISFGGVSHTVPEFCTVTVYRIIHGEKVAFAHTEYFEEACATVKGGGLNSMWTKRKRGQLAKCAEAGALRKAFPEEIGDGYTKEEMEGKIITVGGTEHIQEEAKAIEDIRPTLTEKQIETAIKKIKANQGSLDALKAHYNITPEQENYVRAQTEVLEHDPV
ncbi:phage recombination protein Bet [Acinetobacter radioresistens]|uniref:Phage recombination protein Bet n=1 Tax=Acinetobacter radioresistens SK82 TaxID=596318 RepID=A0ABP2GMA3_ACIRA|nr:phage recombination protein Bet [Acinetobacter radioresistens]EET82821.1 phage recombination protein Bet [Acinetobacter radioresistens SK82]MCK4111541.1 phage recombination protein Bet [Acinetobacter radioresistens]QMU05622.1 phage recombination protein Bet [Acinetobacter radioresistens]